MIHLAGLMNDQGLNTAVGALNQPTFVGKSEVLRRSLGNSAEGIHLTFLVGTDTLHRLFVDRYYPTDAVLGPDMHAQMERFFVEHGSDIVVANRQNQGEASDYPGEQDATGWIEQGKIRFIDIGKDEMEMSSTSVRQAVAGEEKRGETRQAAGLSLEQMTDDVIREYIVTQGLYR